jgi:hypothetical protein
MAEEMLSYRRADVQGRPVTRRTATQSLEIALPSRVSARTRVVTMNFGELSRIGSR